ncbi:hypothetical protein CEXT_445211 [Caerostris extrusa]|uniref:Uncharacterized protein n=1 Tax=Caerostris extrusa TaxID=172846 RepID=A0AAV4XHP3_CAEEX|nr:hypothetical protein CEXT_445211 [Caerostris extrusa]
MQRILRISFFESGTRPSFRNSDSPDRRRVSLHPSVLRHPSALTLTLQEARMRNPQPDEIDPRAVALARKMLLEFFFSFLFLFFLPRICHDEK